MVNDLDMVTCPNCGEITHIGGLIGKHTNDCPRCGKPALGVWPFPTSLVKKPLNDKTPNTNGLSNAQEAPF